MKIDLLWEDEDLLVVNKPAGLLTIRDGYNPDLPYLAMLLQEQYGKVWVVHRLDKDTSGAIIFARNSDAHRFLDRQFAEREAKKEYRALVVGEPEWNEADISLPLRVNGDRKHRTVIDHQHGKLALTQVRVIKTMRGFAYLAALPHTGYTHQIRAHLAAVGLPLLNDPLYQSMEPQTEARKAALRAATSLPIKRMALHALQISLMHPGSREMFKILAPEPADFSGTLAALVG